MTISTETSVVTYTGNGATTVFSFPFVSGGVDDDIEVIYTNASGIETTLLQSQYTLIFNAIPVGGLWSVGGSVTYPISGSPIATGTFLTINRIVPYEQLVSISNQGAFYPQAVEQGLDLLELQLQQLNTELAFCIRCPVVDIVPPNILPPAAERANGLLGFDSAGQPIIVPNGSGGGGGGGITGIPRIVNVSSTVIIGPGSTDTFGGISIYQSGAAITTVQLPATYSPFPIFDSSRNSSTYPILVLPPVGLTILGAANYRINFNGQSATFYNDGNQILIG